MYVILFAPIFFIKNPEKYVSSLVAHYNTFLEKKSSINIISLNKLENNEQE